VDRFIAETPSWPLADSHVMSSSEKTHTNRRQILLKGWKIAYVVEARVYHTHSYTVKQDFKR
jgi:hypothetical protein